MGKSVTYIRCPKCDGKIRLDSMGTIEEIYGRNSWVNHRRRVAPTCEECGRSYILKTESNTYIRIELEEVRWH